MNRVPATDWTYVGDTPYLDDTDGSNIYTKSTDAESGDYSFADGAGGGTINSVTAYFECYAEDAPSNDAFDAYFWDGSGWSSAYRVTPSTTGWGTEESVNVGATFDSWAKIQAAQMYVVYFKSGGPDEVYIRRCYLKVNYDAEQVTTITSTTTTTSCESITTTSTSKTTITDQTTVTETETTTTTSTSESCLTSEDTFTTTTSTTTTTESTIVDTISTTITSESTITSETSVTTMIISTTTVTTSFTSEILTVSSSTITSESTITTTLTSTSDLIDVTTTTSTYETTETITTTEFATTTVTSTSTLETSTTVTSTLTSDLTTTTITTTYDNPGPGGLFSKVFGTIPTKMNDMIVPLFFIVGILVALKIADQIFDTGAIPDVMSVLEELSGPTWVLIAVVIMLLVILASINI